MAAIDKTVATLSTVYGYISDEAQCEAFRETIRALSIVRDVAFTIHEVSTKATTTSGAPVEKEARIRTITEDAPMTVIRMYSPGKLPSVCETREMSDCQASANAEAWLTQLGFAFNFEFIKEGFRYMVTLDMPPPQRTLVVHVFLYKLKKMLERSNFSNLDDMSPGYLVEFQCEEESDPNTKAYGVHLLNFAKSLSPHVHLTEPPAPAR